MDYCEIELGGMLLMLMLLLLRLMSLLNIAEPCSSSIIIIMCICVYTT